MSSITDNTTALQSLLNIVEQLSVGSGLSEDDMKLIENISSLVTSCVFDYTPAIATLSPLSNVDYIVGISDLDAQTMHICAEAISNNSEITNTTTTVYVSNGEINRKISVGDKITIPLNGKDYSFAIIGFNHDKLTDDELGYGHKTATGLAGMTLQLCEGFDTKYAIHDTDGAVEWETCMMKKNIMPLMERYMPPEWSFRMKLVNKLYASAYDITHDTISTSKNNKCFLLAIGEIISPDEIPQYAEAGYVTQYASYRQSNDFLEIRTYWTRSVKSENYFYAVNGSQYSNGITSQAIITTSNNIVFAFCI